MTVNMNGLQLVRAIYDFNDVQEGEIELRVGDIIQILKHLDGSWWYGKNLSDVNEPIGSFPNTFVSEITLPTLAGDDKLLLSVSPFQTDIQGDLCFGPNELIIVEEAIDDSWYSGVAKNRRGIFPRSFTKEIHTIGTEGRRGDVYVLTTPRQQTPIATGLAVVDYEAQCEDEMSFRDGDVVEVLGVVDSTFVIGRNKSSPERVGRLPVEFIYITEGQENLEISSSETKTSKFDWWKKLDVQVGSIEKQVVQDAPSFEEQTAPLILCGDDDDECICEIGTNCTEALDDSGGMAGGCVRDDPTMEGIEVHSAGYEEPSLNESSCAGLGSHVECQTQQTTDDVGLNSIDVVKTDVSINHMSQSSTECASVHLNGDGDKMNDFENLDLSERLDGDHSPSFVDCVEGEAKDNVCGTIEGTPVDNNHLYDREQTMHTCQITETASSSSSLPPVHDVLEAQNEGGDSEMSDLSSSQSTGVLCQHLGEPRPPETLGAIDMSVQQDLPVVHRATSGKVEHVGTLQSTDSPGTLECPDDWDAKENIEIIPVFSEKGFTAEVKFKPKTAPKPCPRVRKDNSIEGEEHQSVEIASKAAYPVTRVAPKPDVPANKPRGVSIQGCSESKPAQTNLSKSTFYFDTTSPRSPDTSLGSPVTPTPTGSSQIAPAADLRKKPTVIRNREANLTGKDNNRNATTVSPAASSKPVPERPGNFIDSMAGSGALMTGPLDPETLATSPFSSPKKSSPNSLSVNNCNRKSTSPLATKSPLVPLRPAPPKPARVFSCENALNDLRKGEDDSDGKQPNESIVEGLERRIEETEHDIQKCVVEQSAILNAMYEREDLTLSRETSENLKFYQANIIGLTDELTQLRADLGRLKQHSLSSLPSTPTSPMAPVPASRTFGRIEAKIERRRREEQRKKCIGELLQTELDFLQSVCICYEVFFDKNSPVKCPTSVDLDFLFGNMHEVIDLSQKFYNLLEAATNGKDFHEQVIGICFQEVYEEFKRVLGVYCRNHDDVISALTKLESNPEVQGYLQSRLDVMRRKVSTFDFGSVLIKPVQRIMKYPLLIGEIIKNTEQDHPDLPQLKAADLNMKEVVLHINECKRRKDLVLKYKRPCEAGLSEKFSKLTMHSIRKKFNRFLTPAQSQDERFQFEESQLKQMNLIVRDLSRDISQYVDLLQVSLMDMESFFIEVVDLCRDVDHALKQDFLVVEATYSRLCNKICVSFKERVEGDIIPTLNTLLGLYQGPKELIRKRQHKLLDYDNASIRARSIPEAEQTRAMRDEVDLLRRTYEAMNSQLLEDLPKLHRLSLSIVHQSVLLFLHYQEELASAVLAELNALLELELFRSLSSLSSPSSSSSSSSWSSGMIVNEFTLLHLMAVDKLSDMSFIPRSFDPTVEDRQKSISHRKMSLQQPQMALPNKNSSDPCRQQTEEERSIVQSSFPPSKLYLVVEDFSGGQILDLRLNSGALVGVIKEEDPMKNKERYFVSNGTERGFVLRSHLKVYEEAYQCDSVAINDTNVSDIIENTDTHSPEIPMTDNCNESACSNISCNTDFNDICNNNNIIVSSNNNNNIIVSSNNNDILVCSNNNIDDDVDCDVLVDGCLGDASDGC